MLGMKRKTRVPLDGRVLDNGRVGCVVSGRDVDLDCCFGCSAFVKLVHEADGGASYVLCKSPRPRPLG